MKVLINVFRSYRPSKTVSLSLLLFLTIIIIVITNPLSPLNHPQLWSDIIDVLGYSSIALFLLSLFSAIIGFIFKRSPIVKKIFHSLGFVGIVSLFSLLSTRLFLYPRLYSTTTRGEIRKEIVCMLCSFAKGDFVYYVDIDKERVIGEIVATSGDTVVIKNNQIFVNNKAISSLITFFSDSDEKTILLGDKEYYILPGDLPRSLNGDKAKDYVIHEKYISGKMIQYQLSTVSEKLSPDSLQSLSEYLTNPNNIFLREVLNNYANNVEDSRITTHALNSKIREDGVYGLLSFDKEVFKDRFFVLYGTDNLGGGQTISFIFTNHPDRIYQAWVYQLADKTFELRDFYVQNNLNGESIKQFIQYFQPLITDEKYTI